jgi:uncharacterized protein YdeI (YjbR/CyaY-like superfamily)
VKSIEETSSLQVSSVEEWRDWLDKNGKTAKLIYLIVYRKKSKLHSILWHDTIEHALCYGWVDSKAKNRDEQSTYLKFTPRNPKSKWSKGNIERAGRMIEKGLMTAAGQELIDIAKSRGNWIEN